MTDEQIDALILSALGRKRSVNAPEIDHAIFRTGMLEAARIAEEQYAEFFRTAQYDVSRGAMLVTKLIREAAGTP